MLATLQGFVREYLADGGPMDMLDQGIGGPGDRRTFAGRTMYPERLPSVALALDITTRLLEAIERFFEAEAAAVATRKLPDPRPPPSPRGDPGPSQGLRTGFLVADLPAAEDLQAVGAERPLLEAAASSSKVRKAPRRSRSPGGGQGRPR